MFESFKSGAFDVSIRTGDDSSLLFQLALPARQDAFVDAQITGHLRRVAPVLGQSDGIPFELFRKDPTFRSF